MSSILSGHYRAVLLIRTEYFDVYIMPVLTIVDNAQFMKYSALNLSHACIGDSCTYMHTNVAVCRKYTNTSIIHRLRMQVHTVEDQDHLHKGEC